MKALPEPYVVARGQWGQVRCAVRQNGSQEARDFLSSAECKKSLPAVLAKFKAIADQSPNDDEVIPKPLHKTKIHQLSSGQVRILCFLGRDGRSWVLTNGFLKKTVKTPREHIRLAERIMQEDQERPQT